MKKADYLTHITDRRNRNLKFFSLFVSSMDMLHALIFYTPYSDLPAYDITRQ